MNWIDDKMTQVIDRVSGYTPPTEEQLRPWLACRTLPELGARQADWLTGQLDYTPSYDTIRPQSVLSVPAAYAALVEVNRAGVIVTMALEHDDDRAAVSGYATDDAIVGVRELCRDVGLEVRTRIGPASTRKQFLLRCTWDHCPGRCECPGNADGPREHELFTWRGCHRQISEELAEVLTDAWQVMVFDPEPGRNDRLWPALARVATEVRP